MIIDLTDHELYKLGAKNSERKTKFAIIINMLDYGVRTHRIAQYVQVSHEYVVAIRDQIYREETDELLSASDSELNQKTANG